jgi:hypothetical protein
LGGLALAVIFVLAGPLITRAERVVPSQLVTSRVIVRAEARRGAADVGSLRPGGYARYVSSEGEWHRIRLLDGTPGYVSVGWTKLEADPPPLPAVGARPAPGMLQLVQHGLLALVGLEPRVGFELEDPVPGLTLYQHYDPNLPVAGLATALGALGEYDVMLVLDVSTSTSEFAEADVNGDGREDDSWQGSDSILKAQVTASIGFVDTLRRLPRNHDGRRIRVGVVTFSGDERYRLHALDRGFKSTPDRIYGLAHRDAELQIPLTSNYRAVRRTLEKLGRMTPVGTTDFAAGIGLAMIELKDLEEHGAASLPRPTAQKAILFMTDGKPRLPYDRHKGEAAALYAAKMASDANIRINAFALGKNIVTQEFNYAMKRMSRRTHGNFIELENPGDIVTILNATSFGFVDRVKLINRTTEHETRFITTGIDGSFYGEVPLEEGKNEIRIIAMLHDDEQAQQTFTIEYRHAPPIAELVDTLGKVRDENEALISEIKSRLATEMEASRAQQHKQLDLGAER